MKRRLMAYVKILSPLSLQHIYFYMRDEVNVLDWWFVKNLNVVTARKRSLRTLCFYTCLSLCPQGGGIPACLAVLQAHTHGGGWGVWWGGSPGPHPGGKLRGLARGVSRPRPRGKVEGSGWGGLQPTPRGDVEGSGWGVISRSTPRGVGVSSMHWCRTPPQPPPADGYYCGRYAS